MYQETEAGSRVPASASSGRPHRLRGSTGLLLMLALAGCQQDQTTGPTEVASQPTTEEAASSSMASFALASTTTVKPWRDETFSTYSSDAAWRSDPHDWMVTASSWMNQWAIHIDRSVTYDGHPTLRYDWPGATATNTQCFKQITREADYFLPAAREVWIEVVHKFATTFNTNTKINGGYCGSGEYKFLLPRLKSSSFRVGEIKNGHAGTQWWGVHPSSTNQTSWGTSCSMIGWDCRFGYGSGQDSYRANVPGPLWDGQWHVYRIHIKLPAYKGEKSGILETWIDGKLVKRVTNQAFISSTGVFSNQLAALALGSNSNSGTSRATSNWWGRLRIWTTNPAW